MININNNSIYVNEIILGSSVTGENQTEDGKIPNFGWGIEDTRLYPSASNNFGWGSINKPIIGIPVGKPLANFE